VLKRHIEFFILNYPQFYLFKIKIYIKYVKQTGDLRICCMDTDNYSIPPIHDLIICATILLSSNISLLFSKQALVNRDSSFYRLHNSICIYYLLWKNDTQDA